MTARPGPRATGASAADAERLRRRAILLCALLVAPLLSGCLSIDFFLPQGEPAPTEPTGNGHLRVFIAVAPGAIGAEFTHYNVTWGRVFAYADIAATRFVPLNSTLATSDLVYMEANKQAWLIASAELAPGTYHGFTHQATNATLTRERVVGNDEGTEVTRHETQHLAVHDKVGQLRYEFGVFPQLTTDLFLELDMAGSLVQEGTGLKHATKVVGLSMYVNGMKGDQVRYSGSAGGAPGDGGGYGDIPKENLLRPVSRYEVYDVATEALLHDSDDWDKRYPRVIGLDQELRFKSRSWSHVYVNGEQLGIERLAWDFADGTTRIGGTLRHNWTSGGIYDVSLHVTDEYGLSKRSFSTFVVPYRPDEAAKKEVERLTGTFLVGHHGADPAGDAGEAAGLYHLETTLEFPEDLDAGDLRLGAYRVTARIWDPTTGTLGGLGKMQLRAQSGHLDATRSGTDTLSLETAGLNFWRGNLPHWVEPQLTLTLDLEEGVDVAYEVTVEALYFENMTRGFDPHAAHRHGEWVIGPEFGHLHPDGRVPPRD